MMTHQELENKVQELSRRIGEFESRPQLRYPLDSASKNALDDHLNQSIVNSFWRKIRYYNSTFETIDTTGSTTDASWELIKTGVAVPDAALDVNGFAIYTGTTSGNRSELLKNPANSDLAIGRNSRFRVSITISVVTNQTSYVTSGGVFLNSTFGFKIAENALYGMFTNASATETLTPQLATISANTVFNLEARYYPFDRRFVFYYSVGNAILQEMASLTGSLAALFAEQGGYGQTGYFRIATSNTTTKNLQSSVFEFLQEGR